MIRVYSVTPIRVGKDELARRAARYAEIAPPGVEVHLADVGADAPDRLEHTEDLDASERAVAAALRHVDGYDHVMPDCVLDPATDSPGRQGMLRLTLEHLTAAGHRIAAVTRNAVIGDELRRKAHTYGFGDALVAVTLLDLGFDAVSDAGQWNAALRRAIDDLAARGATAVINGCSAVEVERAAGAGVLMVDPAATALRRLAARP